MRRLADHLVALISTVAAIAAVSSLLTSESIKTWVRGHSSWVYAGLVVAALTTFLAADWTISLQRKYRELKSSAEAVSDHDNLLFHEVLTLVPADGEVMGWLKNKFFVKRIPTRRLDDIKRIREQLNLQPVGFDNVDVNEAYRKLIESTESFDITAGRWLVYENGNHDNLYVPLSMKERKENEWRDYAALNEIQDAAAMLVSAYDEFLQACRQSRMNIYADVRLDYIVRQRPTHPGELG